MGEVHSACFAEVCKNIIADCEKEIEPLASETIKDYTYVDDGLSGGTSEEVSRLIGDVEIVQGSICYHGT